MENIWKTTIRNNSETLLTAASEGRSLRRYQFGKFTLDLSRGTLREGHRDVKLRPQSFEVLRILVENHGRLIDKNQLYEQVWHGAAVTDGSLTQCVIDIRKATGDKDRSLIQTVPRRGYVFNAPVVSDITSKTSDDDPTVVANYWGVAYVLTAIVVILAFVLANRADNQLNGNSLVYEAPEHSLAVLPFANRSSAKGDAHLVDGIHDHLLTSLAAIDFLRVVSRTSVEQFRNADLPTTEIGRRLGVKSILEGSLQRAGNRIRVNVQLINAETDLLLWAETYDRHVTVDNYFEIQSEIAKSVAIAMEAVLCPKTIARAADRSTTVTVDLSNQAIMN